MPSPPAPAASSGSRGRPPLQLVSLHFARPRWTVATAKAWAKSHGYRFGAVEVTPNQIRLPQRDASRLRIVRTVAWGRGISAVMGRQGEGRKEAMAKRDSKGRFVRRRRGSRAAAAAPAAAAPRRRRRPRRTRAAAAPVAAAPRRRRRRRHHREAAAAAPRRRRRHTRSSAAAPRRRRRRSYEAAAPRYHRRRRHARRNPFTGGEFALSVIAGGLGFVVADFVDRYVATYDPSSTSTPPTDRFTGGTNGTLANALNVASPPSLMRIGVGIGMVALPGIGAYVIKNPMGRAALQGMTLGAAIKVFSVLWNTYVMGNLLKPAGTDATSMKASLGARVYPSEIVAQQNLATSPVPYTAPTGLNAPPGQRQLPPPQQRPAPHGVAGDPGPFAQTQAPQPQQLAAPAPQMQQQQPAPRPAAVGLSGLSPYALGLEL